MMEELLDWVGRWLNVISIVLLLGGLILLFFLKKEQTRSFTIAYLSFLLLIESLSLYIGVHLKRDMLFMLTPSFLLQFLFLTYFYFQIVLKLSTKRFLLIVGLSVPPFFLLLNNDFINFFYMNQGCIIRY